MQFLNFRRNIRLNFFLFLVKHTLNVYRLKLQANNDQPLKSGNSILVGSFRPTDEFKFALISLADI